MDELLKLATGANGTLALTFFGVYALHKGWVVTKRFNDEIRKQRDDALNTVERMRSERDQYKDLFLHQVGVSKDATRVAALAFLSKPPEEK